MPGLTNRYIIMTGFTNRYIIMTGGKRASDTGHKDASHCSTISHTLLVCIVSVQRPYARCQLAAMPGSEQA